MADGRARGDRTRCPSPGCQLDENGRNRHDSGGAEGHLAHRHWEATDYYGMVMIYRSACGGPQAPYRLPPQPKIDNRQFVRRGWYDAGEVDMHIAEFAENSVDFQHFAVLHGAMRIPWTNIKLPGVKIRHEPSWSLDAELPHVSYFGDEVTLEIKGRDYESGKARALITFLGPGSIVKFDFDVPGIGEVTMFQTHTPVEPLKQRVTFRWYAPRHLSRILVSYVVGHWISQWRQDLGIWKAKTYRERPLLTVSDGPVSKMRKWYGQFYPGDPGGDLSGRDNRGN